MATASPPACSLLLPSTAAISSARTYASCGGAPRFLASPRSFPARRPLSTASSPKVAAPAAVEMPEEYFDEIEAVNIALDVTQVRDLFPTLTIFCASYSGTGVGKRRDMGGLY